MYDYKLHHTPGRKTCNVRITSKMCSVETLCHGQIKLSGFVSNTFFADPNCTCPLCIVELKIKASKGNAASGFALFTAISVYYVAVPSLATPCCVLLVSCIAELAYLWPTQV